MTDAARPTEKGASQATSSAAPGDRIATLFEVQDLDLQLDGLSAREAELPEELTGLRREMDDLNNRLEDTEMVLERIEAQTRRLDLDLKTTHEQMDRTRAEQEKNAFDARAQAQYGSRLQQLSERAEEMEEDLAPLRERESSLLAESKALREQHRALRPRLGELEEADEQRIADLRASGEDMRERRKALLGQVDPRTAREYETIRRSKGGLGIATLVSGRCSACNVSLPVNVQQRVSAGRVPPVKCPSCGRFLLTRADA
ncbi:zinc ribbon domain-containing protein [Deinococcus sp. Marseille-Q6407]|uniref:zinc ribbon domain-containing protein n=1 Tax=Deinococcus sp. Marseille-Q6407 TaxID=2969223 RepID=UPI0021C1AF20|nr:C4-type zinc ribbon domain-containing protein [Deinococcus sp. Marseille-Q6407]